MSPCGPLSALWGGQHHWPSQTRGMLELREVRRQAGPLALQTWVLPRPFSGLCPMHTSSHWMSGGPCPQPSQQALGPAYSTSNVPPHPTATVSLVPADVITRLVSPLAANCRLGPCWPPHVGAVSVAPFPHTHFLPSCTPPFESTSKLCPCPRTPLHRHTHLSPSVPALRLLCIAMPTSAHVSLPSRSSALPCPPRPMCLCPWAPRHHHAHLGPGNVCVSLMTTMMSLLAPRLESRPFWSRRGAPLRRHQATLSPYSSSWLLQPLD